MYLLNRLALSILFGSLFIISPSTASNLEGPQNVLLLLSYKHALPWQQITTEKILSALESSKEIKTDIHIEYTGLSESQDHLSNRSRQETLRNYYLSRHSAMNVDLLISVGFPSSSFAINQGRELFGDAPVVLISSIREDLEPVALRANVTGVFESIDANGCIETALRLLPQTRQITVISGSSKTDRYYLEKVDKAIEEYEPHIRVDRMIGLPVASLGERVKQLPGHSLILYVTAFEDNDKRPLIPAEVAAYLASNANAPIFGLWESMLGSGIVGGKLSSPTVVGEKAARMALDILSGKAPANISAVVGANAYMFDWRQLKKWHIREERLPKGSIVRYKTPSFFELYGTYIVAAAVLMALQALLIAALLFNRNNYMKAERALAKSHEILETQVEQRTQTLKDEIHDRKSAEQRLQESESFLSTILDSIQDGITVLDRDLNIVLANKTMKALYDQNQPLEGKKCYQVYFARDERCQTCPSVRAMETGKMAMDEIPFSRFGRSAGTAELFAFPIFDPSGRITSVVEYLRDITERARSRALLAERELIYRSFFDKNISVILIIDPEDGSIIDANPSACKYYGYAKKTLTKMRMSEINTLSKTQINEEMALAKLEKRSQFHFRHRLSNGDIRDVEVFSGPISVSGKTALCSIVHDISKRKEAEQEREKLIAQLQKALSEVKTLQGFLPICASCKKIRDDKGYWNQIESYIQSHSDAKFSHGLCPECAKKLYPDFIVG